jgi:hypothetical protein
LSHFSSAEEDSLLSISFPFVGETNFETFSALMAQFWTKTLKDSGFLHDYAPLTKLLVAAKEAASKKLHVRKLL